MIDIYLVMGDISIVLDIGAIDEFERTIDGVLRNL